MHNNTEFNRNIQINDNEIMWAKYILWIKGPMKKSN